SREANARALTLERLLLAARLPGLIDTVPSFRALLVQYDARVLPWATLHARLSELALRLADAPPPPGRRVELPCASGGPPRPAPEEVAGRLHLTAGEVVALHAGAEHYVYFVGFTPGLPYMAGQPERLTIPRLDRPRTKTPPGSVAIGGAQTSIYSVESPGGFWLLGRTPLRLYDPPAAQPIPLPARGHVPFPPSDAAGNDAIGAAGGGGGWRIPTPYRDGIAVIRRTGPAPADEVRA